MKPVTCLKRDDCVRACIASMLELEAEDVPHFFEQKDDIEDALRQMHQWFAARGEVLAGFPFPGGWTFESVTGYMQKYYLDKHYMLWCQSGDGDHAVVGRGDEIVWNPAWYRCGIDGPHSLGVWIVWVIAKL